MPMLAAPSQRHTPAWHVGLVFLVFAGVGLAIFAPVLHAPTFSDDAQYLVANPWIQNLTPQNLAALFDPKSAVTRMTQNYNPINLLLHALEWKLFGPHVFGYHVVNVVMHALAATLFVILLWVSGMPPIAALLGGSLFFTHPASVEAVAWISQLKTTASLSLALGALLLQRRHPWLAVAVFALALGVKPSAAVAAPVAFAYEWVRARKTGPPSPRTRRVALAGWTVVLLGFVILEGPVSTAANFGAELHSDFWVRVRTIPAFALRYLVTASTTYGIAPFQDPPRAVSPLDPWWLGSIVVFALLAWRFFRVWTSRREEAIYWVWAAGSFALVSQVVPFTFPMADRYLYYMLPGLIGAAGLAVVGLLARLEAGSSRRRYASWAVAIVAATLAIGFLVRTATYVPVWRSPALVLGESTRHYPEGRAAYSQRAQKAALAGDAETAAAALRVLSRRGEVYFTHLVNDPAWASVRGDPRVQQVIVDRATWWIEHQDQIGHLTWMEYRLLAQAHMVRREFAEAARFLERALESDTIQPLVIRQELDEVRRLLASSKAR